jgi:hypothetical protein
MKGNPDKEHFDNALLKELAWKLDREVWAHVQNPNPSEDWSTSKAREKTRELCLSYLGAADAYKEALKGIERLCDPNNPAHENIWRITYEALKK